MAQLTVPYPSVSLDSLCLSRAQDSMSAAMSAANLPQRCCNRTGLQFPTALPCLAKGLVELSTPMGLWSDLDLSQPHAQGMSTQ